MAFKYLVYDNPKDTEVSFVTDTNGKPRVYTDLDLAEDCANNQTNGYVVPLGWDPIDTLTRLVTLTETMNKVVDGDDMDKEEMQGCISTSTTLMQEIMDVLQQKLPDECESTGTIS